MQNKKVDLQNQIDQCEKRLERAQTLIQSLGGEQVRWEQSLKEISQNMKNMLANSLFATTACIYTGAFNSEFRQRIFSRF